MSHVDTILLDMLVLSELIDKTTILIYLAGDSYIKIIIPNGYLKIKPVTQGG